MSACKCDTVRTTLSLSLHLNSLLSAGDVGINDHSHSVLFTSIARDDLRLLTTFNPRTHCLAHIFLLIDALCLL